jgi:hypothetical protein
MGIFIPYSYLQQRAVAAGAQFQFRTDPYASSLKLAVPGALFTELGMSNYYDDVHADIAGTGTNISNTPTGSGSEFYEDTTNIKWASEQYDASMFLQDAGCWGAVQQATSSPPADDQFFFGSNNWVIEGWYYMTEQFNRPPFWKVGIRHVNYYINCDFGFPNDLTFTKFRGRIILDTSTTGETQYFASDQTNILNSWVHVAWVRSGNTKNFYYNGTRYMNNTAAIGSIDANTGFIRILRGESTTNDGASGAVQDFRVYIGTDKGYTGSTITTPDSIVEYLG